VDPRHDVHRQEVHRVHEQHEHEGRERERRDQPARALVDRTDLVVDESDREFAEGLGLRRHARGRLARDPPQEPEAQRAQDERRHHRVDVHRPEAAAVLDRLRQEGQVVLDVAGGGEFRLRRHRRFFRRRFYSRANRAVENSDTVTAKAAKSAATTTSWYVASTSQSWRRITRIFAPSARSIVTTEAPAVAFGPIPSTNAYTTV